MNIIINFYFNTLDKISVKKKIRLFVQMLNMVWISIYKYYIVDE